MKKLVFFLAAVLLTAFSAKTFAQSTGYNPMIDSTHTYSVATGANSYTWTLTTNATDALTTSTDLINTGNIVSVAAGGVTQNTISLKWINPTIGSIYYLHVEVEGSNGCTNHKVMAIQPVNNFQIYVYNIYKDGALMTDADSLDHSDCSPDNVEVTVWNGSDPVTASNSTDFAYNYGADTIYYKVEAKGINFSTTKWNPTMTIAGTTPTGGSVKIETITGGTISGGTWAEVSGWSLGTAYRSEIAADADNDVLWVRVVVNNGTTENLTDYDYSFTLDLGATTSSSVDGAGNHATNTFGTAPVQTQKARPTISITTD